MTDYISWTFAALALLSALLVISATNPIHSVFFLILVFCFSAALLFLLHADFLAMIFLVVYVGAIAVLFLFVVMMLNLNLATLHENLIRYLPVGFFIGFFFLFNSFLILDQLSFLPNFLPNLSLLNWSTLIAPFSQLSLFGQFLYTLFVPYFLLASMILFVAMIGAIVLTTHPSHSVKRQDIHLQLQRDFSTTVIF